MRPAVRLQLLAVLLLSLCAGALCAQSFDFARDRQPILSLDGLWRFHPGDSPTVNGTPLWASSEFDDSSWSTLRSDRSWSDQGYRGLGGFAWYRFKVVIPAGQEPTDILLAPMLTSYRVFVDGHAEGGLGKMASAIPPTPIIRYQEYPLTLAASPAPRTIQVAIRVWNPPIWAAYVGGGPFYPDSLAGDPSLLAAERTHHQIAHNAQYVDAYVWNILTALVGLTILALFFMRPAEREYLWFALMLLAMAADTALSIAHQAFFWPSQPVNDFLDGAFSALVVIALLCFFSRVLEVPLGKVGRIALGLAAFSPFPTIFYWPGWASPGASASIQIACVLPATSWILFVLARCAWRGNLDARILLLPAFLDTGFFWADNVAVVLGQLGLVRNPRVLEVTLPLPPFNVQLVILFHLVFLLALLVFLIRRFAYARQREQRLQGEFEAARQVQLVLLPDQLDQCPGFHVESFYRPADEVGGDFFQQISDPKCGMLVVIGDVSGKGLSAAMIVSVLVGAIRTEAAHGVSPAELLKTLNERMLGRPHGGFVTCLAAFLSNEGKLTLANAGHLPPYLNGHELAIPSALPLGILDCPEYDEISLQIDPGDRLTFVSDGVVEAQSSSRELFGFDRTRAISTQSAEAIAKAAQQYGQQDDITVLTVAFVPAEALHA
ncbi:MAG TPA: SpoIIE family protein phosphatase [Terracidiphilus sp.]|nr:SpoIIE family protein phosphatase [Terracidiphilus sp.]